MYSKSFQSLKIAYFQVQPGEELRELRAVYWNAKVNGYAFPWLKVTYKFNLDGLGALSDESHDFHEMNIVDCGGPIRSFLCSCWNQFWNDASVSQFLMYIELN